MERPSDHSVSTESGSKLADARRGVALALASVERGERNALEGLRQALCSFVVALREGGASKEDAMAAVKALMAEPATPDGAMTLLPPAREALVELSTYWCAQEYAK